MTALSQDLRNWSIKNPSEQGDLALKLASSLEVPAQRALWSLVDLPTEFERRVAQEYEFTLIAFLTRLIPFFRTSRARLKTLNALRICLIFTEKVLPLFYLFPIAITWFNLSNVVESYSKLGPSVSVGSQIDFLTYWSGAGESANQYSGSPLSEVALSVVGLLVTMILLHLLTIRTESEPSTAKELRALVLESQLVLAESRAITPDELTDTLSIAANQLKTALEQSTASMQSVTGMNDKLISVTNTLGNVSNSLSASAQKIEYAVQPLALLPGQLSEIFSSVSALPEGLSNVQREIQESAVNLANVSQTIQKMAQINTTMNEQTTSFVSNLSQAQRIASDFVTRMEQANLTISDLTGQLNDREPHLVQLREITEKFDQAVKALNDIAEEFRYSADKYSDVNEAHRSGR